MGATRPHYRCARCGADLSDWRDDFRIRVVQERPQPDRHDGWTTKMPMVASMRLCERCSDVVMREIRELMS